MGAAAAAQAAGLAFRAGVALLGRRAGAAAPAPPAGGAADLPVYTVLGAMYREPHRVRPWLAGVAGLAYPHERLDVRLVLEEDDAPTRRAAERERRRLGDPPWLRLVVVPPGEPRTKPRALAHALPGVRGELLTILDAEDVAEPRQLLAAVAAFRAAPPEVACLQARPVIVAEPGEVMGRLLAAEYRVWHGGFLPGLARLRAPVPLAGTSNHLRVAPLRALGGWDPANVTEDAELGVRLARAGMRTEALASVTREESTPPGVRAWMRQRSRWSKGYLQTWAPLGRHPARLAREIGPARAACLHLTLAGTLAIQLTTPPLWAAAALAAGRAVARRPPAPVAALAGCTAVAAAAARLALCRAFRQGEPGLGRVALAAPAYWALEGLAAWRGVLELAYAPRRWHKTEHPGRGSDAVSRPAFRVAPDKASHAADGMTSRFSEGDRVAGGSHGGQVRREIGSDTTAAGRTVRASEEEPLT